MKYNYIKTDKKEHQFLLTLARPEKRNAFTPTMVNEVAHALETANNDPMNKVVLLKAEGPVICSGMDLTALQNPDEEVANPAIETLDISLGEIFERLTKPLIAI